MQGSGSSLYNPWVYWIISKQNVVFGNEENSNSRVGNSLLEYTFVLGLRFKSLKNKTNFKKTNADANWMWFYKPCFLCNFEGVKLSLTLDIYRVLRYPPGKTLRFCLLHLPSGSSPHTSTHFTDKTVAKEKAATGDKKLTLIFIIDTIVIGERQDREQETAMTHLTALVMQWR